MATYAIGDIHGCYKALKTLVEAVNPKKSDLVVTLGDYVDRGPDTRNCIKYLIEFGSKVCLVPLRGNHEVMMMEARRQPGMQHNWLSVGGEQVLESYRTKDIEKIPTKHWDFLNETQRYHETATHIFVHAGLDAAVPMDSQSDWDLYWEFFADPAPHVSGKTMICGHSSQKSGVPLSVGHAICIDTYAYGGQWLTCLDVETNQYVQANEAGEVRRDVIA